MNPNLASRTDPAPARALRFRNSRLLVITDSQYRLHAEYAVDLLYQYGKTAAGGAALSSRRAGVLDDGADDRVPVSSVQFVTAAFEADEFGARHRF